MRRASHVIYPVVMLILAFVVVRFFNERPGYTDAYYHYNAAVRLASGDGFIDDYLWVYIGAPDSLPAPSHLYWMPLTSIVASLGMRLFGISYLSAQIGLILAVWGAALITYWLALRLTDKIIYGWTAGIIFLAGGFLMRMWGVTDTFAVYAFVGSAALVCMGLGLSAQKRPWVWWLLAGVFAALGHLTRSDGLLLVIVGIAALFWPGDLWRKWNRFPQRLQWFAVFVIAYIVVMMPWFLRNLDAVGSLLPVGGTQAIWYTDYNDLFSYPPDANPQTLFVDGTDLLIETRLEGLSSALQNLLAIEGYIFLLPFMLWGLWLKRRDPFLRPMWLFALGIHLAFALVFTFPGIRGGLYHAIVALMPFWCVLGFFGMNAVIVAVAKRLEHWNAERASMIFSWLVVSLVVLLGLSLSLNQRLLAGREMPAMYQALEATLPDDARVMINDPAQLYYFTELGGVVIPNETPETALTIAEQYDVDYLLVEYDETTEGRYIAAPEPFHFDLEAPPAFLDPIDIDLNGARLYAINR